MLVIIDWGSHFTTVKADKVEFSLLQPGKVIINEGDLVVSWDQIRCIKSK